MSNVVQLRPKGSASGDAMRDAIEEGFFRLADTYGAHAVVTVMVAVVVKAIEAERTTRRPGNKLWIADLKRRLEQALKEGPGD